MQTKCLENGFWVVQGITAGFNKTATMLAGLLAERRRRLLSRELKQEEYQPMEMIGRGLSYEGVMLGGSQQVSGIQECIGICAGGDACQVRSQVLIAGPCAKQ